MSFRVGRTATHGGLDEARAAGRLGARGGPDESDGPDGYRLAWQATVERPCDETGFGACARDSFR
jgi:hypothetical protein